MTDSGMSVEPTSVGDAAGFEFSFVNNGSDSRHPVVVATTMTPDDLRGHIEQNGIEEVIKALLDEGSDTWELVYPGLESGQFGHYHPNEDQPDLPQSALTRTSDGGKLSITSTPTRWSPPPNAPMQWPVANLGPLTAIAVAGPLSWY
jgi:hypothetical protein